MISRLLICFLIISIVILSNVSIGYCDKLSTSEQTGHCVDKATSTMLYVSLNDWSKRAFQAYFEEKPEIAIWALKNFTEVIEKYYRFNCLKGDMEKGFRIELINTHVRLALIYQKINNQDMFEHHLAKSQEYYRDRIKGTNKRPLSNEEIIGLVKQIDAMKMK